MERLRRVPRTCIMSTRRQQDITNYRKMISRPKRPGVKNASGGNRGGGNEDVVDLGVRLVPSPRPPSVMIGRGTVAPSQVTPDAEVNRKLLQCIGALTVLIIKTEFEGGGRASNNIVAIEMDVAITAEKLIFRTLQSEVAST